VFQTVAGDLGAPAATALNQQPADERGLRDDDHGAAPYIRSVLIEKR
jgi:hypothetical protein